MEPERLSPVVRYYGSDGGSAAAAASAPERMTTAIALPPEQRLSAPTLAALGALAGVLAIVLGAGAFVASARDDEPSPAAAPTVDGDLVRLLASPKAERIALRRSVGRIVLVAEPGGDAALVLEGLGVAPAGRAYQAWVLRPGAERAAPAALFSGAETVVPLTEWVPDGGTVAVTLEQAGGAAQPSRTPRLSATL
jgi:hypothetical protein